jgi:endonuclease/exonuclease/phosphatase family metal-dependent hydrolase
MQKKMLTCMFLIGTCYVQAQNWHNLMTFNIRLNTPADKENAWPYRKEMAADLIKFHDVDICGMQEAFYGQVMQLDSLLPQMDWVGRGRDDGKNGGEFSCIFYNKTKYKLLATNTFWLSQSPDSVSYGWEAKIRRVVTWAKFKYGRSSFYVFNTHFDHQAPIARKESAKLLLQKVKEIAGNQTSFVMGDFNATPSEEPIKILLAPNQYQTLFDTETLSSSPHYGPYSSFNGFGHTEQEGRHIDFIFSNKAHTKARKHATITQTWGGRYASDHHPVMVQVGF